MDRNLLHKCSEGLKKELAEIAQLIECGGGSWVQVAPYLKCLNIIKELETVPARIPENHRREPA